MTEHLSRHRLEQLIAGSTRAGRASTRPELQAEAHVLSCDVCTTRRRSIETARSALLAQLPPEDFARATLARAAAAESSAGLADARRAKLLRWTFAGGVLALVAACLLWIQRPLSVAGNEVIRFKGPASLEVFVKRGERVAAMRDGDALAGGDQLGFVYTLAEPRHLLLLSIDDTGAITRYFPSDGNSQRLAAGARVQLPLAVELDAHRGEERLVAFFSDTPLDENAARRALAAAFQRAGALSKLGPIDVPAQQTSIGFRKP
jgi:hypothetical protein